ncbi:hypothetical protein BVG19_g3140 [[Candida] boidinii]|nr:hypothetical protein BVG19_g3140 [[Candida] boidinii]OWB53432.1 hypothetical protein B5S27_g5028 [[Candida] boidinii]
MPPRSSSGRGRYGKIPPRSRHYQQQSASQRASSAASASSSNLNTQQQSTSSSGSSSFSRRSALNKNNSRYNNSLNNHGSNSKTSASAAPQGPGSVKASAVVAGGEAGGAGNTPNTSTSSTTSNTPLKNSKNDQLDLSKYNFNKLTNPSETLNNILKEIDLSYDSSLGLLQGDSIINLPSKNKLVIVGKLIKKMIKELDGIIAKDNSYLIRIDEKISKITGKPREFQKEKLIISLNKNRKDDSSSDLKRKYSDIDNKGKQSTEKLKDNNNNSNKISNNNDNNNNKINNDDDSSLVAENTGDDDEDKLMPKKRRRKITLTNKKDPSSNNNNNSIKESAVDDKSDSDELSDLSVKKESEDEDDANDLSSIKSIEIDDLDNGSSIDTRIASVKKEDKESVPTDDILSGIDDDADEDIKPKNRHTIKIKGVRSDAGSNKDDDDDAVVVVKKEKSLDTDKKIKINEDDEDEDEEKLKINKSKNTPGDNEKDGDDDGDDDDDDEGGDNDDANDNKIDYELDLQTPRFVPSIYKDKPKIEFPINEMIEPVVKSLDLYPRDPEPCPPDESTESEEFLKKKYAVTLYPHDSLKSLLPGEIPLTDFSGTKPNNQVAFTTFQTYIEPIFKLFSDDDIRFLKNKYNLCSNLPKDYDPKITPFLIPKLGAIYTDVWHQEDINSGMVKVENPKEIENFKPEKIMIEHGESMIRPNGSEDNITNEILETEDISCGPLTSRLLSAIMSEDLCDDENGASGENGNSSLVSLAGTPFDDEETNDTKIKTEDDENNGGGGTTLWKSSVLKSDYSTLEERLKTELKYIGVYMNVAQTLNEGQDKNKNSKSKNHANKEDGEGDAGVNSGDVDPSNNGNTGDKDKDDQKDKEKDGKKSEAANTEKDLKKKEEEEFINDWVLNRQDDEISSDLRSLQKELKEVTLKNMKRKKMLLPLVEEQMAWQEYISILEDLDKQVEQSYRRRISVTPKKSKKKGSSGGSHHSGSGGSSSGHHDLLTHQAVANSGFRALLDKREKWIEKIGPLFPSTLEMRRMPKTDIFKDLENVVVEDDDDNKNDDDEDDEDDEDEEQVQGTNDLENSDTMNGSSNSGAAK